VPILISLDHVLKGENSKNLTKITMAIVCNGGGLGKENIAKRHLSFGTNKFACNNVYIFHDLLCMFLGKY